MGDHDHVQRQRRFYDTREHSHLQAQSDDFYAAKLARELAIDTAIGPEDRVLELGAGFGRFTFALLEHCRALVAMDLSPVALARLGQTRDALGIDAARCETRQADVMNLGVPDLGDRFDVIAGFFLLHHLPDVSRAIASLGPWLAPGGRIAFVEPNRRNPLFLAQVAACPDMTWAEEKGMFQLSRAGVEESYRAAGLQDIRTRTFGFFPPQVLNRFASARRLEERFERIRALRSVLPFLLLTAEAGEYSEASE